MVVVRNKTTYFFIDLQNIQEKAKFTENIQRMLGGEFWVLGDDFWYWGMIFGIGG